MPEEQASAPAHEEDAPRQPIWSRFQEAMRHIPQEELDTLPPDGATEHDHYFYGTPKRQT
jgi:hypothetical protein